MSKIIYFTILVTLPLLAASIAYAQPRGKAQERRGVICGYVMKSETFFIKSTPVVYVITDQGRAYTLYSDAGRNGRGAFDRQQLIQGLHYLQTVCLNGLAFDGYFVPDAIVVRNARKGREAREQAQAPQQQPTQRTNPPRRNSAWIPWTRSGEASP